MFVFPDLDDRIVGSHGFSVAVRLARGAKIALAPAVLACLYRNLTFLTQHAADFDSAKKQISVPGPFQILQLWALERFPLLGSKLAKPLSLGQPRIGRWDKVSFKASLVDVRKALRSSGECFCWRPYALDLKNWRHRYFNLDVDKLLSDFSGDDDELKSFRVCLQPTELIGMDCTATYEPQRVMMQFVCGQKVHAETEFSIPLESGKVRLRLLEARKPSEEVDNTLQESAHGNAIIEGLEPECKDDDHKKLIPASNIIKTELNTDVTPEREILNVSASDNVTRDEEQSSEGLVVMDSDDKMADKMECKDVMRSRSRTMKSKTRVVDSADYPLLLDEYSSKPVKKVKKSGISFGNPIDVENYWLC
ncbi:hypothetical protein SOVF_059690 [Spinacia oleracea]|nr:hypothetical protein SOVF_059690 [Spinacia oleracea]